jgi:hypothetical protein
MEALPSGARDGFTIPSEFFVLTVNNHFLSMRVFIL